MGISQLIIELKNNHEAEELFNQRRNFCDNDVNCFWHSTKARILIEIFTEEKKKIKLPSDLFGTA